jgi:antitoxin component of RelBE/YafQ-DinJ toxin-antitoxin module
MFYRQIVMQRGLPFEAKIPNKETVEAFSELDQNKSTLTRNTFEEFDKSLDI